MSASTLDIEPISVAVAHINSDTDKCNDDGDKILDGLLARNELENTNDQDRNEVSDIIGNVETNSQSTTDKILDGLVARNEHENTNDQDRNEVSDIIENVETNSQSTTDKILDGLLARNELENTNDQDRNEVSDSIGNVETNSQSTTEMDHVSSYEENNQKLKDGDLEITALENILIEYKSDDGSSEDFSRDQMLTLQIEEPDNEDARRNYTEIYNNICEPVDHDDSSVCVTNQNVETSRTNIGSEETISFWKSNAMNSPVDEDNSEVSKSCNQNLSMNELGDHERSKSISPSKIRRSTSPSSPQIEPVISCSQASYAEPDIDNFKLKIVEDEPDIDNFKLKIDEDEPDINNFKMKIDEDIKLLNLRIELERIDFSKYLLNGSYQTSSSFCGRKRNKIRAGIKSDPVDEEPTGKRARKSCTKNEPKTKRKSSRLKTLAETQHSDENSSSVSDDDQSIIGRGTSSNLSKSQSKTANKKVSRRRRILTKRKNSSKNIPSAEKTESVINHRRNSRRSTNTITSKFNSGKKNQTDNFNQRYELRIPKVTQSAENDILILVDKYKRVLTAWYECLCCNQKYHQLDHIKEHVRGHFPDCLTS